MEPRIALDVAELLFHTIFSFLLIVMIRKIARWDDMSFAWLGLMMLCLVHVSGAGTSIGEIVTDTPWPSEIRGVAAVSHVVGFAILLHSLAGFITAACLSMFEQKKLLKYFAFIQILILISAIVNGVGTGVAYEGGPEASDWRHHNASEAGAVMFAILAGAQILVTTYLLVRHRRVQYRQRRIVVAVALCLPFAVAENLHLITVAFAGPSEALSLLSKTGTGVLTNSLFTLVPDTAVLVICYWTGCLIKLAEANPGKLERIKADLERGRLEEIAREVAADQEASIRPLEYAENDQEKGAGDSQSSESHPNARSYSITAT